MLPDGGWNCDEGAYLRSSQHSSFVSTLVVLEALLYTASRQAPLSEAEERIIDEGARYLLERRLMYSISRPGAVANESWKVPIFPRFYEYDVLRAYEWLVAWSRWRKCDLLRELQVDMIGYLQPLQVRDFTATTLTATNRTLMTGDNEWEYGALSSSFPLLEVARNLGVEIIQQRVQRLVELPCEPPPVRLTGECATQTDSTFLGGCLSE